jgi:hypothetical protein
LTGALIFEILLYLHALECSEKYDYFILKGSVSIVKRFLRFRTRYAALSLVTIFLLQFAVQLCLCEAAEDIATGDNRITSGLKQDYPVIPKGLIPRSEDDLSSILLTRSGYPIRDEDPIGEMEKPHETPPAVEPVTRVLPIGGKKSAPWAMICRCRLAWAPILCTWTRELISAI